jgi:hypothetical protein
MKKNINIIYLSELPKPFSPLLLSFSSVTSINSELYIIVGIICAILSPTLTLKSSFELLNKQTTNSPVYPLSITPAKTSIPDFTDRPDLGAILT